MTSEQPVISAASRTSPPGSLSPDIIEVLRLLATLASLPQNKTGSLSGSG
jgi:hypothetical protein